MIGQYLVSHMTLERSQLPRLQLYFLLAISGILLSSILLRMTPLSREIYFSGRNSQHLLLWYVNNDYHYSSIDTAPDIFFPRGF